jgi:NitT/TauT family transport system ATP-binding protein
MTFLSIDIQEKSYAAQGKAPEHCAIRNLTFSLGDREFVCLVGPSGCGKTTLLHILAGLDRDFQGRIASDHEDPITIGYVFQQPRLLPWRTVRENIELALPSPESARALVDHLLEAMNIAVVANHYPERLSLGMSRRVALVRAFALQPTLLLMDEPFVSLDTPTARGIRELMIRVWLERPHTVLFVTHDLREAIALADRLIFLKPPPTSVLREIAIPMDRAERDDKTVAGFTQHLLDEYPDIRKLL